MNTVRPLSCTNVIFMMISAVSITFTSMQNALGVTVIQDEFNSGAATTGATSLPGTTWGTGGNTPTETGGNIVLYTGTSASQYKTSSIYTTVAPSSLNLFQQTISMSVRGLALTGDGDAAGGNSRFRIGLTARSNEVYSNPGTGSPMAGGNTFGQFYNSGNDGIVLNLTGSNAYQIYYKTNALTSATDPNSTSGMSAQLGAFTGMLAFTPVDIDFTVNSSSWEVIFYGSSGQTSTNVGTWDLTSFESTWGNSNDGLGNSSFLMDVQTTGAAGTSAPTDSINGSATATINSIQVTASPIPEPSKVTLFMAACAVLFIKRKRPIKL